MGKSAELELTELKQRTADRPPKTDWSGATSYSPVVIPGLLEDLDAVNALAADYESNGPDDAMIALTQLGDFAEAFARCGEPDRAMDYIDRMRGLMGPHIYLLLKIEPGLDSVRDHPRYIKYRTEYEQWATGKTG